MDNEESVFDEVLSTDFVNEIFKACLQHGNKHLLQTVIDVVKDNYLPEEEQRALFTEIKTQFRAENRTPSFGSVQQTFSKNRAVLEYLVEVKDADDVEENNIFVGLENFVKQSAFVQLYDEIGEMYNKGQKKQAFTRFVSGSEKLANFSLQSKKLTQLFADFGKRNSRRLARAEADTDNHIPTGIIPLDKALNGGPEIGELICWLGDSKAGKSFALSQCGFTAARLGYPVLHVQAEDTEDKATTRYDSQWMGIPYFDVKEGAIPENRYAAFNKLVKRLGKTDIHIYAPEKFGAITIAEIRKQLIELKKQGIDIKVLVVDYWDLINPDGEIWKPGEERFRQQAVGKMLKELAMDFKLVVHTATQTSSIASELTEDEKFVITREHLAEDKGKVRPVNALISINVSRAEKKRKEARLYVEATRDNEGGQVIKIKRNLKNSRFYDHHATMEMYDKMDDDTEAAA